MKVCFLCPHTKVSGGVKVIFTLAHYLSKSGEFDVTVAPRKYNDKVLAWFDYDVNFKIEEFSFDHEHHFEDFDIVLNYLDGVSQIIKGPSTKHILFLQGFGTQNITRETKNLQFPFEAVITTSAWLHGIASSNGHLNTYIVPPGIDHKFKRVNVDKPRVPIIGGLFHNSPTKNFPLFEATIQNLVIKKSYFVRPLILAAKKIDRELALAQSAIPTTIIIDPPQMLIPNLYSMCSVWLATSTNEGFGLPPLEAMACGCPVVLYPNDGLNNIAKSTLNCISAKNKFEAADAIITLLENAKIREDLVHNGFSTAAKYTWEKSAKLFSKTLLDIAKG